MRLRIGLVGSGDAWQTRHLPALRVLHDRFDVRAVFSPVAKLAENIATEFQADPVDGYRALVTRCDIDAVLVLQKDWLGWLPTIAACEAGKAVYWAAGFDFDAQSDRRLREQVDRSGVSFMVELPRRFAPATLRMKELIATRLGHPKLIFCHRRVPAGKPTVGSATHPAPADPARGEFIELIDWCQYIVGYHAAQVSAVSHGDDEQGSYRCLSLRFPPSGERPAALAQVSYGNYIRPTWKEAASFRPPSELQISCERGVAFLDLPSSLVWFDEAGRHVESLETETPVGTRMLSRFHRCVTGLLRDIHDLGDLYAAAAVYADALRSERR